jgi:hypothetical protein
VAAIGAAIVMRQGPPADDVAAAATGAAWVRIAARTDGASIAESALLRIPR